MHIHHVATDEMGIPQINVLDQEVGMVTPMCLHLTSEDLLDKLPVPDEALSLLMGMGYKENAAKRALRMTGQDVQPAVHFLVEEEARKILRKQENIQRQVEIFWEYRIPQVQTSRN
ncbi:uncharacterized protein LOC103989870 [Musa acuminata AAA Group]|uniref:uncharacterized protein LOC103989870 n=1 Tax=Musa acuminata AAA Group TaxID=214697 RepID=UPI0031E345A2